MSEDYGLLGTVRDVLSTDETLKTAGIHQRIYFKTPSKPIYPYIVLGIDKTWQDHSASDNQAVARINFHINLSFQSHMGSSMTVIGQSVASCLDACSIRLSPFYLANFRKTGNVIDLPMILSPRSCRQFYQAVVWRKMSNTNEEAI